MGQPHTLQITSDLTVHKNTQVLTVAHVGCGRRRVGALLIVRVLVLWLYVIVFVVSVNAAVIVVASHTCIVRVISCIR